MLLFGIDLVWYITAIEVFSLAVAFVLSWFAYRSYRKSRAAGFLLAAVGFAVLGAASLVEGFLYEVMGLPLDEAHAFRSILTATGLVVMLYSIYRTR